MSQLTRSPAGGTPGLTPAEQDGSTAFPAVWAMRILPPLLAFSIHAMYPVTPGVPLDPATPFADPVLMGSILWFLDPIGHVGVSFFFLLTGFSIMCCANVGEGATTFWRRRFAVLLPSHVVTWALAMLLYADRHTPYYGLPNLLLINAYFPQSQFWGGANGPAWRLCVEVLCFLVFPLLVVPLRRLPQRLLWPAAGAMVAGMVGVCAFALLVVPSDPTFGGVPVSLSQYWFVVFFPPVRLFEFVLGMVLARIVLVGRWPAVRMAPVLALLAVSYGIALWAPAPYDLGLATVVPIALLVGTVAAANLRGVRTVLGSRSLVWLGKVAFGFYLTQAIVLFWGRPAVLGGAEFGLLGGIVLLACLLAVNLLAGWVLYRYVELPAARRLGLPPGRDADRTREGAPAARPVPRSPEVTLVRWPVVAARATGRGAAAWNLVSKVVR